MRLQQRTEQRIFAAGRQRQGTGQVELADRPGLVTLVLRQLVQTAVVEQALFRPIQTERLTQQWFGRVGRQHSGDGLLADDRDDRLGAALRGDVLAIALAADRGDVELLAVGGF